MKVFSEYGYYNRLWGFVIGDLGLLMCCHFEWFTMIYIQFIVQSSSFELELV